MKIIKQVEEDIWSKPDVPQGVSEVSKVSQYVSNVLGNSHDLDMESQDWSVPYVFLLKSSHRTSFAFELDYQDYKVDFATGYLTKTYYDLHPDATIAYLISQCAQTVAMRFKLQN